MLSFEKMKTLNIVHQHFQILLNGIKKEVSPFVYKRSLSTDYVKDCCFIVFLIFFLRLNGFITRIYSIFEEVLQN